MSVLARRLIVAGFAAATLIGAGSAAAENDWNPFRDRDERARSGRRQAPQALPPPLSPMDGVLHGPASRDAAPSVALPDRTPNGFGTPYPGQPSAGAPFPATPSPSNAGAGQAGKGLEVVDLAPVTPSDGSGLPEGLWNGLDVKQVESLIAPLQVPPKSAVLHGLWTRLLASTATPPAGGLGPNHFLALQLEALYRSGRIAEMGRRLDAANVDAADPLMTAFRVRRALASGERAAACDGAKTMQRRHSALPQGLTSELALLAAYCAAADGNMAAAGLAADLARDDGIEAPLALAVIDALTTGSKPRLALPDRIVLLDFRLMELIGPVDAGQILDKAEPALLSALAGPATTELRLRVAAAEAAARLHAIDADALGDVWRAAGGQLPTGTPDPLLRRARLFSAIETERTADRRLLAVRALLDDGRKVGLSHVAARAAYPLIGKDVATERLSAADAATATEVALTAGEYRDARRFAEAGGPLLGGWLALIDVVDPGLRGNRETHIGAIDELARRGRFAADMLHRVATVLDALDVNVPIPLWEAASRTPQPTVGHLPETGILPQLQDAAKKKDVARTILLAMRTLGPNGADAAHMIALGDSIRALRRAGLDADARRLGLEALLAGWPRAG